MMDGVLIVELVALAAVGLAQVGPGLFVDENGMAEAEDTVHQCSVTADVRARNDHKHRGAPRLEKRAPSSPHRVLVRYGHK